MASPEAVARFWLEEVDRTKWYNGDVAFDAELRNRFGATWDMAMDGGCGLWLTSARDALAYVILTDQFPRNMFRGNSQSFASDCNARAATKIAIDRNWDMQIDEPQRQFFYTPLMHSENLIDQDRCVRLIHARMPETGHTMIDHAKAHRYVIRQFGRFPYRNAALGRVTTQAEQAFLDDGGYGAAIRAVQAAGQPS